MLDFQRFGHQSKDDHAMALLVLSWLSQIGDCFMKCRRQIYLSLR
jgi:hypothetical protein